ncbi:MAG: beta-N-acetylhexosaminidase [Cyclobacteriaceae bacterium]
MNFRYTSCPAFFLLPFLLTCLFACESPRSIDFPRSDLTAAPLIPKPLMVTSTNSGFPLDKYTVIEVDETNPALVPIANYLAEKIGVKTGLDITVGASKNAKSRIAIALASTSIDNPEAYQMTIDNESIMLRANTPAGAFRGIQTIRQLIPETSNKALANNEIWVIPSGEIKDAPQYAFRSTMLDVSRHFFDAEYVKKYIDLIAYYKLNALHLHLSDDQGWRIEIKSWPKLTEVGGSSAVGGGPGGYYTQEEFKEIVSYANDRYLSIIPEIDMPGHTNAASVSYPFLNGNGKALDLYTGTDVGFSTFDTRKDTVYAFIDDVIREIAAISPSEFFHIGGDESHVTEKDDYHYFVSRLEKVVQKYGKRLIGWDEVVIADLDASSVAQVWNSQENGQTGVAKGMQLILSPAHLTYLDMKYDSLTEIGYDWAGYIPLDTGYRWNPEDLFPIENVLGIEAPLWSETFDTPGELEFLAFPRIVGYAELGWSTKENRNWEDYKVRLAEQSYYFRRTDVNFYRSPIIDWKN